ncbi:MAG TPA: competence/damage-inducible protein A [Candidatus Polarisedimenticolia bacterium]|nr:competence/damage-inducible protein A [Candidatus Polarisedimenticolia bacterium]
MTSRRAELVAVGSELLEPWRTDSNGSYLSRRLGEIGVALRFRTIVGDVLEDLRDVFRVALGRSDLIVVTGGLGPTIDDLTREALASLLDLPRELDEAIARRIEERFGRHGLPMPPQNRRQAMVPRGAVALPNRVGTAPGLLLRAGGALVALLPGVPSEMRTMVEEQLLPRLGPTGERFVYRVLKIAGLPESEVDRRLEAVARGAGEVAWTILAAPGQVEIHLRERVAEGRPAAGIERLEREIETVLREDLFGRDDEALESVVGELLKRRGATLGIAESLTGGAIGARITRVPGASRYFKGSVVCYSDEGKVDLLGVRRETLAAHSAVSPEAAREMADGVCARLGATWGLAATGYAGPEGGGPDKPPGTVCLALSGPPASRARTLSVPGDRDTVRTRTVQSALDLLRRALLETVP